VVFVAPVAAITHPRIAFEKGGGGQLPVVSVGIRGDAWLAQHSVGWPRVLHRLIHLSLLRLLADLVLMLK
jgi:hypothetical protein